MKMVHLHVIYDQTHSSSLLILLILLCCTGGKCLVVKTYVGDDAVIPCEIDPTIDSTIDSTETTLEWSRLDLPSEQYVHYQRDSKENYKNKNPSYMRRTSVFMGEFKKGNMSLKLSRVTSSDEGNYTCSLPEFKKTFTVQLIVGERGSDSDSGEGGHFPWWGYLITTTIITTIITPLPGLSIFCPAL